MSQENVELVQRWVDRWNRGDRSLGDELHPDVEIFSRFQSVPYRGADGLRRWTEEIDEQFQAFRLRMNEWRDVGADRVVVLGHIHLQGHGSGVQLDQPSGAVVDIEEGKLRRLRLFVDQSEALEAAGLRE